MILCVCVCVCACPCACAGLVLGAWCSFSGGDGWLCACVQHLWKGKEALQARDGSQCKSVRHRPRSPRCAQVAAFYASHSDEGWLCACLQSLWKGKNPLQARGPANSTLCRSCIAVQMSFVALELLLCPLLAGMMAGCVLVCRAC